MFELLFQRSADAIWLFDPRAGVFVDCNQAAVELFCAGSKANLLQTRPETLSPPRQPDGSLSRDKAAVVAELSSRHGGYRFEWLGRRLDGREIPLEVVTTPIPVNGYNLYVVVSRDITERKRAEAEIHRLNQSLELRIIERTAQLAASEARFRALVEHAPEAITVFDGETGRFLFANEHACRLYGVAMEELTQLTPADVSPERQPNGRASAELAREMMRAALAGGTPVFEWLHRHSSGRLIPTEVRLLHLPAEGKNVLRASIIDNTERHRRALVQQATYQISEAVQTTEDLDSLYRQIHEIVKGLMPAENLYLALRDADGQTFSFPYHVDEQNLHPEPKPVGGGLTGYVLRTGKPFLAGPHNAAGPGRSDTFLAEGNETVVSLPCGHETAVWLGAPLTSRGDTFGVIAVQHYHDSKAYGEEEKQILSFVAVQIAQAIERKRAQQALRESEEKFRALFAASSQGVMLHDEQQYLEVNPAAVRILGYHAQEELIGKHPRDTSPPFQPNGESSAVVAARHIEECLTHGSTRFEWVGRTAQGRDIPLEVTLTRIQWSGRQILQAYITDISERKQAEIELHRTLAREMELGQLRTNFVSMVSHEFRTPLGIIQSSAEILRDYFNRLEPAERGEQLHSIVKNTRRMAEMMEEILVLGRLDSGKMPFQPERVDLAAFCQRVVAEIGADTEQRCPIELSLPGQLPEARADESLLSHVFTNLLLNSVKYSHPGCAIRFALQREGNRAVCVIRDEGIGIPAADQQWLFNPFQRGANVGDRPGTGLGLVLVKRCVELHGGTLAVASAVGQGTTVTVRLPLFEDEA